MKRIILFLAATVLLSAAVSAEPELFPFKNGIRPLTPDQEAYLKDRVVRINSIKPNRLALARSAAASAPQAGLPPSVSNWQYLPKVGNQGGQGSCAAWSTCYYYKTYQEAKEHGWNNPDYGVNPDHVMSPAFCYNLVNGGEDGGSMPSWIMQMIADHGDATWQDMPYDQGDYLSWPSQAAWKNALLYRAQSAATIDITTDAGITALKQQLANGDIAVIAFNVTASFDHYPSDYPGVNSQVLYDNSGGSRGGHAVTVMGYDDTKSYVGGNGVTQHGAFKIVNSWGNTWGITDPDIGTKGFVWMAYAYLKSKTGYGQAWTMVDRTGYQPTVYGTFGLEHPSRGDLNVYFLGGSNNDSPDWSFNALPSMGGTHAVAQKVTVDLSLYSPDLNGKFWLKVSDSLSNSATGQITYMGVQQAGGQEEVSADTPKNTQNGSYVYVQLSNGGGVGYTALDPSFTQVNITSLTVTWDLIPGANYTVVLSSDSYYTGILSSGTQAQNSINFPGLSAGARYYFQVKISTESDMGYFYNRSSARTLVGTWSAATAMSTPRGYHAAILLPDGRVLVAGGSSGSYLSSAEVYDPGAGTWSSAGSMAAARTFPGAVLLSDGRVLVSGGSGSGGFLSSSELYDPETNAWSGAGSMSSPRGRHTATLLPNGKVLVTGGYYYDSEWHYLSSAEFYDPKTNVWSSAGSMFSERVFHTATLLPNGKVLVAGGDNGYLPLASAELYDPVTNSWSAAAAPLYARYAHTATLLPGGKVLVAGGGGGGSTSELYDSNTNSWSSGGDMLSSGRQSSTSALLPDGKVLVAGGQGGGSSTELYDPKTNGWSSAGSMLSSERAYGTASLLPDGRVLVAGGYSSGYLSSTELFSPADLVLTKLAPVFAQVGVSNLSVTWTPVQGANYTAVLSSDASFMNLASSATQSGNSAGFTGLSPATRYFFEVKLSTETEWAYAGNTISTATPSPAVLSWTGETNYAADGLDPETGTSTMTFTYRVKFTDANGKAPAAGYPKLHIRKGGDEIVGSPFTMDHISGGPLAGAIYEYSRKLSAGTDYSCYFEAYDSDNNRAAGPPVSAVDSPDVYDGVWAVANHMSLARSAHAAVLLPGGRVLMAGGSNGSYISSAELYDPNTNAWSSAGSMSSARTYHSATLLSGGKVLVVGGAGGGSSSELYDPDANSWSGTGSMASARYYHTATMLPSGKVLVAGGSGSGCLSSAELYDPNTNTWSSAGSMSAAREFHAAVLLSNGKVLVTGGYNGSSYLSSADLYDPNTNSWSSAGPMSYSRGSHTATLLPGGKVLIAGGGSTAELYDPNTNTWSSAGSMYVTRYDHTATLLPDGRVLVAGGSGSGYLSSTELYDPNTNTWSNAGAMSAARYYHTATLLPSGKALVAGGYYYENNTWHYLSSAELYTPVGLMLTKVTPSLTQVGFSSFTVTWTPVAGANYTAVLSTDANFISLDSSVTQGGNSATFTGLAPLTRYFFEVKLSTEAEWAYFGNRISAATPSPATALHPQFFQVYAASATVTWDAVPGSAYTVVLGSDSFYTNIVSSAGQAANTKTFTGLSAGTSWYFEVKLSSETNAAYAFNRISTATLAVMPYLSAGPVFTHLCASSMTVNWSSGTAAIGFDPAGTLYTVELSTDAGFQPVLASSQTYGLSGVFEDLSPNTSYYARVQAMNGGGTGTDFTALGATATLAVMPGRPAGDVYTKIFAGSMTVNWSSGTAATGYDPAGTRYKVEFSTSAGFIPICGSSLTYALSAGLTGLEPDTIYYSRIAAVNRSGEPSLWLVAPSTATLPNPPADDSSPVRDMSAGSFEYRWSANDNPSGTLYVAQLSTAPGFSGSGDRPTATAGTSANFAGLTGNTAYYARAYAIGRAGHITQFNTVVSTVTPPQAPAAGVFSVAGSSALTANWGLGLNNAAGLTYLAQLSVSNVFADVLASSATAGVSAVFGLGGQGAPLTPDTSYYVRVLALGYSGAGNFSDLGGIATLANAPSRMEAVAITSVSVSLDWLPNGNPEPGAAYELWRDVAPGFTAPLKTSVSGSGCLAGGLSPLTTYYFKVRAVNKAGVYTDFDSDLSVLTHPPAPGAIVMNGTAAGVSSVRWAWNDAGAGTAYRVVSAAGADLSGELEAGSTFWVEPQLSTNTAYSRMVVASNLSGISTSAAVTRFTLAAAPAGSGFLEVWHSSASMKWSENGDPPGTSFEAQYWTMGGSTSSVVAGSTCAVLTGLAQETTVYARVRALNGDGIPSAYDGTASTFIPNTMVVIQPGSGYTLVYDQISLNIAPDTFNETVNLLVKRPAQAPPDSGGLAGFSASVLVDISALNPLTQKLQPLKEVIVAADYRNMDLEGADEGTLVMATYNESRAVWVPLPSVRDRNAKTVTARTGHFSLFQLMHSFAPESISGITVGPNPLRPVRNPGQAFTFRHLPSGASVKIYTCLGELLYETAADTSGMAVWDGKNKAGRLVGSDVYLALLKWKGERKVLKLVMEK